MREKSSFLRKSLAVDGKGVAGQGPCPQGHAVGPAEAVLEALAIPGKHLEKGQEIVGQQNWLGLPQMGVSRNHQLAMGPGLAQQLLHQSFETLLDLAYGLLEKEAGVDRHLVVSTPSGVQFQPGLSNDLHQACFHEAVNILVLGVRQEIGVLLRPVADFSQSPEDLPEFLRGEHSGLFQCLGVSHGALDIFQNEPPVQAETAVEALESLIHALGKSSTPDAHCSNLPFPCATNVPRW